MAKAKTDTVADVKSKSKPVKPKPNRTGGYAPSVRSYSLSARDNERLDTLTTLVVESGRDILSPAGKLCHSKLFRVVIDLAFAGISSMKKLRAS